MPLALPIPRGALIVSCQARVDNPLHGPDHMAAMAAAAEQGGARAIRANGAADISTIRKATRLPIVGIAKRFSKQFAVYITPDIGDAVAIAEAGCSLIALDATARPRDGMALELLIPAVKQRTGLPVFADIASVEEARNALQLGADCVATTLSGYTVETAARWAQGPRRSRRHGQ